MASERFGEIYLGFELQIQVMVLEPYTHHTTITDHDVRMCTHLKLDSNESQSRIYLMLMYDRLYVFILM